MLHITACTRGFYLNNSYDPDHFDPTPKSRASSLLSHTLPDLLAKASPKFRSAFKGHLESGKEIDPILTVGSLLPTRRWLVKEEEIGREGANQLRAVGEAGLIHPLNMSGSPPQHDDSANGLYGLDPKGIRDWNEEY